MRRALIVPLALVTIGCAAEEDPGHLVWAMNVGGPDYVGADGTSYEAETSVEGGTIGRLDTVKGSQDPLLYETYREGDVRIARRIQNGTYDVTFHFAEPEEIAGKERIFDAIVEGRTVIDDLDVMSSRDGKVHSALTVTVPNIEISDGELNIEFEASVREPVLSALVVRDRNRPAPEWKLVWSDEFNGDALDTSKWSPNIWPPRKVNDEDQAYTDREKNLRIEDGHLLIEAHREDYDDARYTSARIHSDGKGDFLYGRFEVRAKLPYGKGSWPAIWMLPSDPYRYSTTCEEGEDWQGSATCDAWPNSGEIDIMEHVGYEMDHIHGTVHNEAYYWAKWEQRKGRILIDGVDEDFHVYALEWSPERIDVFVDDSLYFTYVNENDGWRSWPYDHPFHLILNIAVGGMWGRAGGGIDDEIFPQRMLVDYVRVYELGGDVYTTGPASRDGIGKFYMGREISHVMGHLGAMWLERPEREREERTDLLIESLPLDKDDVVADIGAGTGYFSFPIAARVPDGKVLAVDIQQEMLDIVEARKAEGQSLNVETVLGTATDPDLADASVDLVLIVDAYHEFSHPREMGEAIASALKPGGELVLIEYRGEDGSVPIKRLHKMTEEQAKREMAAVGLEWVRTENILPQQHFLVFRRP